MLDVKEWRRKKRNYSKFIIAYDNNLGIFKEMGKQKIKKCSYYKGIHENKNINFLINRKK